MNCGVSCFVMIFDTNLDPLLYVLLRNICFWEEESFIKAFCFCTSTHHAQYTTRQSFFGLVGVKRGWFDTKSFFVCNSRATVFCAVGSKFCRCGVHFPDPNHLSWTLWLKIPQSSGNDLKVWQWHAIIIHVLSFIVLEPIFLLTAPFNFLSNHGVNSSLPGGIISSFIKICN